MRRCIVLGLISAGTRIQLEKNITNQRSECCRRVSIIQTASFGSSIHQHWKNNTLMFHWWMEQSNSKYTNEKNLTAQPLAEYPIALTSTISSTLDVNSFNENRLQTMIHGNYITGGVFNINLAPAKNEVRSPEVDPKRKKRRLIIESDSSQESTTWCYNFKIRCCCYRIFLFFIRILTIWNRKYKYYCLYLSFITLHPSFKTFLWQAFCDSWPL